MPDVRDGLTVEGEAGGSDPNSEEGFNALLAQQTGRSVAPPTPEREAAATGDEIRRALVEEGDGLPTDIRSGLTVAGADEPRDPTKRALLEATDKLAQAVVLQQSNIDAQRSEQVRDEQAAAALAALEDATSDEEVTEALLDLPRERWMDAFEAGLVEEDELERAAYVRGNLLRQEQARRDQETVRQFAAEAAEGQQRVIAEWAREQGLNREQAEARLKRVDDYYAPHGIDLAREADLERFENMLRLADSATLEAETFARTRAFHESIMATADASVDSGLEKLTDRGWVPVQPRDVPLPAMNVDRVLVRAVTRPETPDDVRAQVGAQDATTVADGFTSGGKRASLADVLAQGEGFKSAADKRAHEQREARARDMSILG